jgi:hypothetical protein
MTPPEARLRASVQRDLLSVSRKPITKILLVYVWKQTSGLSLANEDSYGRIWQSKLLPIIPASAVRSLLTSKTASEALRRPPLTAAAAQVDDQKLYFNAN